MFVSSDLVVLAGRPFPQGAFCEDEGTNCSLWSEGAERVELCLFDDDGGEERIEVTERSALQWHCFVGGVGPGQRYGYRVHGPYDPERGLRFNADELDPYAGPTLLPYVPGETIIYEAHVKGISMRHFDVPQDVHNEANMEDNQDGANDNRSWNCGVEGETDDPDVLALRARQQRNLLATLILSQGVPMILGGDEAGRTQRGSNNAWCQDNEIAWQDWDDVDGELLAFTQRLIALRQDEPVFRRPDFLTGRDVTELGDAWTVELTSDGEADPGPAGATSIHPGRALRILRRAAPSQANKDL